jgi:hypothetical protein
MAGILLVMAWGQCVRRWQLQKKPDGKKAERSTPYGLFSTVER